MDKKYERDAGGKAPVRRRRKKTKRRIRPGCALPLLLIAVSAVVLFLTPIFNVKKIEVVGNVTVSDEQVLEISGLGVNDNLFRADTKGAKKRIQELSMVESVKVERILPDTLKITVTEGQVAAYLEHGDVYVGINEKGKVICGAYKADDGMHILKDESGRTLVRLTDASVLERAMLAPAPPDAPVVLGITVEKSNVGQVVRVKETSKFEILLRFLDTFAQKDMIGHITEFDITEKDYISFRHLNLRIEFGSTKDFDYKFSYIMGLLDSLGEDVEGSLNMISENYTYGHTVEEKN